MWRPKYLCDCVVRYTDVSEIVRFPHRGFRKTRKRVSTQVYQTKTVSIKVNEIIHYSKRFSQEINIESKKVKHY